MRIQQDEHARTMNFLLGQMEAQVGLSGLFPRIEIPEQITHSGPMTLNNINVKDSVVGTINTGDIERLDLAMSNVRAGGEKDLADVLQRLTQSVLDATDIAAADRQELLECLSHLAGQAVIPKNERQLSLGRRILSDLERLLSAAASLTTLVPFTIPVLHRLFSV